MNPQVEDARDQALLAASVPAADRAAAEAAFEAAYNRGLGGEEAIKRAFLAIGTPAAESAAGVTRFKEVQAAHEARRGTAWRRWRRAIIAAIVVVVMVCVVIVVSAGMATRDDPATPTPSPTAVPTVHAVIDRPLDANGTPPAP